MGWASTSKNDINHVKKTIPEKFNKRNLKISEGKKKDMNLKEMEIQI